MTTRAFGAKLRYSRNNFVRRCFNMAHPSIPEPDPGWQASPSSSGTRLSDETDFEKLVAKFVANGGGNLPAQLATDLALEVVLNQIAEQACTATGATGAAVMLERAGEMVCRASSGATAPELGSRLGSESGLTVECIRTRQMQRCDDAQADARADAEACRGLGVRSVMILPLVSKGELAGVLEVFSSRVGAFAKRDGFVLEELARRIVASLERAAEPFCAGAKMAGPVAVDSPVAVSEDEGSLEGAARPDGGAGMAAPRRRGVEVVTYALAAAVVGCALLLGSLISVRMGWVGRGGRRKAAQDTAGTRRVADGSVADGPGSGESKAEAANSSATVTGAAAEKKDVVRAAKSAPNEGEISDGSLIVYEDGKEIFHLPGNAVPTSGQGIEAGVVEVPAEVAEGSLVHRVEPDYPEEARQQWIQGAVVLDVRAGRDGTVQEVKLVSGQTVLADAAIAAVKQWRFKPRVVKGQAVEMQTRVTLNFRLPQ